MPANSRCDLIQRLKS